MYSNEDIIKVDPEIAKLITEETNRQRGGIELIASENFVSPAVMAAMGSPLTNKYAEGYPGKRYYGGCEVVDKVENIARDRAKELFGADHVNVQPNSGSQANQGVFFAVLSPGDTIMGMDLSHGGHLTHGSPVNMSGKHYNVVSYEVDPSTQLIDYDAVRQMALEHKPKMIIAGASAYSRDLDFAKFREIADEIGAYFLVDMAHVAGLVAVGLHSNPVPYADFVTTTTHKTLRGPRGGMILCKAEHAVKIDRAIFPGIQGGPLQHVIAAKAVSFLEALQPEFKTYQEQVLKNAKTLADALKSKGFNIVSGGTDNHLLMIDLRNIEITGKDAERLLDEVGVTCNKNTVPFETTSPFITSGIRLGTPAVTTRGLLEEDMEEIAEIIYMTLKDFEGNKEEATARVKKLVEKYPLY